MNQGGGIEGLVCRLDRHPAGGDPFQFAVEAGKKTPSPDPVEEFNQRV